jgi:hypothetical protein
MKIDSSLTLTMRMYYTNHFEVIKYIAALIHLIVYNGVVLYVLIMLLIVGIQEIRVMMNS